MNSTFEASSQLFSSHGTFLFSRLLLGLSTFGLAAQYFLSTPVAAERGNALGSFLSLKNCEAVVKEHRY